jgi:predicted hydrocarbon binding protein
MAFMAKFTQDDFKTDSVRGLKLLGKSNMVLHCHHYNARIQTTLEQNSKIDGKHIVRKSTALIYNEILSDLSLLKPSDDKFEVAQNLYSFLGFGTIDFRSVESENILCHNSHYVEGFKCGSVKNQGPVCRMSEGFIEGAYKSLLGENVSVEEIKCMNQEGVHACEFKVTKLDAPKYDFDLKRNELQTLSLDNDSPEIPSNIDKELIIETVLEMPLEGNEEGLIPTFNVYLAHTPQDLYNLMAITFIKEMNKVNLGPIAKDMLIEDAENCALHTFGGIMDSEEWAGLVKPMIRDESDNLFGINAIANALGWGRFSITKHTPRKSLEITSFNGYEATGFIEFENYNNDPQCYMLTGITAGMMELIYERGELKNRVGKYYSKEHLCMTKKDKVCQFFAEFEE